MTIRALRYMDDTMLRRKCGKVEVIDDNIREILNDMTETLHAYENGAGLAANQIGILKRLIVVDIGYGPIKLVNPVIIGHSGSQRLIEGCLSIPEVYGRVLRPRAVVVSGYNENGKAVTIRAHNRLAVCLCHEIDHLDGILFTDKLINSKN